MTSQSPPPPRNPFASKKKRGAPPRPQKTLSLLFDPGVLRAFALGAAAVAACLYALVRAYTHKPPPMVHYAAADASAPVTPTNEPGELPAPDLEIEPAPAPMPKAPR